MMDIWTLMHTEDICAMARVRQGFVWRGDDFM